MQTLGIDRSIIVQPSVYQSDHACTLMAAQALGGPDRCRIVAVVDARTEPRLLREMHSAGVRGARINTVSGGGPNADELRSVARLIAPWGWHLQLFMPLEMLAEAAPLFAKLPVEIVIDHMGAPGAKTWTEPFIPTLLRVLELGHTWIKLSGYYISSVRDVPWPDMGRLAHMFAECRPDRLVWGSNWPHPLRRASMPADNDLLDALAAWLPDPQLLQRILVDNPAALYGFEPWPS